MASNNEMSFDDWVETYRPVENPDGDSGFFIDDICLMFETFGEELKRVQKAVEVAPDTVWTAVDGYDGKVYIGNGYHYVNRIGYFITELPFEGDYLNVRCDD